MAKHNEDSSTDDVATYFRFVDYLNTDKDLDFFKTNLGRKIFAEDLTGKTKSSGSINKPEVEKRLEAQPLCQLCEKLDFFVQSSPKTMTEDKCIKKSKEILSGELDLWIGYSHLWKPWVPRYAMTHHYGNYSFLLARVIVNKAPK